MQVTAAILVHYQNKYASNKINNSLITALGLYEIHSCYSKYNFGIQKTQYEHLQLKSRHIPKQWK
jgi:hypothetical protein